MIKENKILQDKLIKHLMLGKPILNKARKPIGEVTAKKYRIWIKKLDSWFKIPFSKITEESMDEFRIKLRDDKIRNNNGKPYKESVKLDIENKILKTILSFLGKYELTLYSNKYSDKVEIEALSKEEVYTIIDQCDIKEKLIFQLLFDGGFRASELLNVKYKDIKDNNLKNNGYYQIRITKSKTLPRTVGLTLPESTQIIQSWLKLNKDKIGTTKPIIDTTYDNLHKLVKRKGLKALKKNIYPHMIRHSSATYYCKHLSQYQMCKRYGWSMASNMPQRYIDREGVDDETINKKVIREESISYIKEINKLKEKLNIQIENSKQKEIQTAKTIKKLLDEFKKATNSIKEINQNNEKFKKKIMKKLLI